METNKIKEVAPGVFWVLLWCPEAKMLHDLLDPELPYVLCWGHSIGNFSWREFRLPVVAPSRTMDVWSRVATFDFLLKTKEFIEILPQLGPALKAVQLSKFPPDYLDMETIKGKQLYQILDECGWHVLLETPASDYGQVMSPHRELLEYAVEKMKKSETGA